MKAEIDIVKGIELSHETPVDALASMSNSHDALVSAFGKGLLELYTQPVIPHDLVVRMLVEVVELKAEQSSNLITLLGVLTEELQRLSGDEQ